MQPISDILHALSSGVELRVTSPNDIREESTMERMLCVELVNIFEGLERNVSITVTPDLDGFSSTG